MTLQEAINSGKQFTRQSLVDSGDSSYFDSQTFIDNIDTDDILAVDYILMPDKLSVNILAEIWNKHKAASTPTYTESRFFQKMISELRVKGLLNG